MRRIGIFLFLTVQAWGYVVPVENFNSGQVSPLIEARASFAKYSSSSRTLENMLVTTQGPVLKRPGTKYIATAKTGIVRLVPFEYSTDDAYIIEAGNLYMRFYRDGAQILDPTNPVEIVTVYSEDELFDIHYAQTDNEMYLATGDDPPQILSRTDHDAWTIADVTFETGPYLQENDTATTITPSNTSGTIQLIATDDIFESTSGASHVGSIWQISQIRPNSNITGTFTADGTSAITPHFSGSYGFVTSGAWVGTVTLQRSTDSGTSWNAALVPFVDTNFDNPAELEEDNAIYRCVMSDYTSGTCNYAITITDNRNKGVVRITAVNSPTTATATVITELVDTSETTEWREGYWSDFRGWPQTVAFHQQRLVYGGSESYPQTIWFGRQDPDDYGNFTEGTLDTSAFTIALEGQNPLRWLLSQDYLLIGSSGSCGRYGDQGQAATPTSPSYQEQTRFGAAPISAILSGDSVLFVERGSRNIRKFGFSLQQDKYLAPNLNVISPEITDSGIKEIAYQVRPTPILWCVLNDGEIAALTYDREQEVTAWTKQVTGGDFESVAVISSGAAEDEVWVSVARTVDGATSRYVEQFQPQDWGDDEDAWFVDSGSTLDLGAAVSVTGATQADPGVITAPSHGFTNGEQVTFDSVEGMIELNGQVYTVAAAATNTFALKDVTGSFDYDTSDFTAYVSSGTAQQVENAFANLDYLEGEEVTVYADGVPQESETVASGTVTIDVFSNVTTIGQAYTAKLETLPLRIDPQDFALNKKIRAVYIDFYKTGNCKYASAPSGNLTTVNFWQGASVTAQQDLYTSVVRPKRFTFIYAKMMKATVYLEDDKPTPLGVRAIVPEITPNR